MKILALEFSTAQRTVAVLADGMLCGQVMETEVRSNSTLALAERALAAAQLGPEQIDCLVVGLGPGSYTGIRSAIAVAQGWQLARGVRLLGISSVECLAAQAHAEWFRGRIHIAIDAQRDEFHLATCVLDAAGARLVEPLRLATRDEVRQRADPGDTMIGPELDRWFPDARVMFPEAATLGRLAAGRADFAAGEQLEPIYLRETRFVKAPPPRVLPAVESTAPSPLSGGKPGTGR